MRLAGPLRAALLVGAAAALLARCAADPPASLPPVSRTDFTPLRPPVLGLAIERREDGVHRLVRCGEAAGGEILAEGSLEECERALVADLEARFGRGRPNLRAPTLGGLQLWADRMWLGGWRIQEQVYTGHFRLLDPRNRREAWGSWEECRTALERVRLAGRLPAPRPRLVLLVHGLGRATGAWERMEQALRAEGWDVARITYPSTRRSLAEHAAQLAGVLDRAEGVEEVSFVTHSLGGLVARALLARAGDPWRERIRTGRLVMLAPPSRGSTVAAALEDFLPFTWLAGPVARELAVRDPLALPPPPIPFAIIAGGKGDGEGWNPLLTGDDDGVVTVEETRLEGAAGFLVVPRLHTWIMRAPEVVAATVAFLRTGSLPAAG
ncbi:MAG: hypothetical protein D6702_12985 [Planctomycetota bacterium]|nr:MAG: hypothetical protein D6702_12985 [Planctomycetota bacterium]